MVDSLEKFSEVNISELKESILGETLLKDQLIIENEVDVNWKENNTRKERTDESPKSQNVEDSEYVSICLEGTILEELEPNSHQSQFLNNWQANWLNSSKNMECPKCKVVFQNQLDFLSHYQSCRSKDDIYSCEKCTYQCEEISMLNFHTQLMHSSGQIVINIDKINDPQKKCVNLTLREIPEKMVVSGKSSNTKGSNDVVEQDDIVNPLNSKVQRNSVENDYYKAPIAKVCKVCDVVITTKVTVTDRCKTCNDFSKFRCNQCNKYFPNYQSVSQHLWTECICLECDFRSPYKFGVHCDKYHPVPVLQHHQEKKAIESNKNKPHNAKGNEKKAKANSNKSVKRSSCLSRLKELRKSTQFIIWYCSTCKKDIKLKSSLIYSYIQTCEVCNTTMWCKCAKCKKSYKKSHEFLLNHLKSFCYREELLED